MTLLGIFGLCLLLLFTPKVFYFVPCVDRGTVGPEMENSVCLARSSGQTTLGGNWGYRCLQCAWPRASLRSSRLGNSVLVTN